MLSEKAVPLMLSEKAVEQMKTDCRVSNASYAAGNVTGRRGTGRRGKNREYLVSLKWRGTEDQESENAKSKRHDSGGGDNRWAR